LEFVDGPTLGDRIAQGAIPIDEALPIAIQVAEALEAAHEQGVIHRDLKPANIKLRPDGTAKVLDFGLAKLAEPGFGTRDSGVEGAMSLSPTITSPAMMTGVGVLLGTAAYMSPEQAKGRPADKRSDIWAFGCVLYEMLTGKRPFHGADVAETVAALIRAEPDWTALPPATAPALHRLLRRCLQKDSRRRLRDVGDARLELEALVTGADPDIVRTTTSRRILRKYWWVAATILLLGVSSGIAVDRMIQPSPAQSMSANKSPIVRSVIDLPSDAPLALRTAGLDYDPPVLAVSSDGAWLVYVGSTLTDRVLYLRDMSTGEVRSLPGTDGAIHPFFSPDGRWIGFLTKDQVKKIPRDGGTVITLCPAISPILAWWINANVIYFTETETFRLSRVSADGGKPEPLANVLDLKIKRFTDVLPDEQNVLAETWTSIGGDFGDIVRVNLRTKETKVLVRSGYGAQYVPPGYLLFARGGNLMAVRYDTNRDEIVGDPVTLAAGVGMESLFGMLHAASSSTGVAAFASGGDLSVGKLAWIDFRGTVQFLNVPERVYGAIDLAPDGNRIAVQVADVKDYIWIWDVARQEGRRVVHDRSEGWPRWNSDGRRLTGIEVGSTQVLLHDIEPSGTVNSGRTLAGARGSMAEWSPGGDVLAVENYFASRIDFVGVDKPTNVGSGFEGFFTTFSPDGRWIAYQSTQTGSAELFIRSYPQGKIVGQVSTGDGWEPRWTAKGDLFYRSGRRWFTTHVSANPEPRWDPPHLAFQSDFTDTPGQSYDVTGDGQRILVVKRTQPVPTTRINLLVNWFEEFNQPTAAK
jgi:Tol biopolymer transport system component